MKITKLTESVLDEASVVAQQMWQDEAEDLELELAYNDELTDKQKTKIEDRLQKLHDKFAKQRAREKSTLTEEAAEERCEACKALLDDNGCCPRCCDNELTEEVLVEKSLVDRVNKNIKKNPSVKDEKKALKNKKVDKIIARDFNKKLADCHFYKDGNNLHPLTQKEWIQEFASFVDDPTSPEYKSLYNAIVTTRDGRFIRRGVEDLLGTPERLIAGKNDKVKPEFMMTAEKQAEAAAEEEAPSAPEAETAADTDGDKKSDAVLVDTDGDAKPDGADTDGDGDVDKDDTATAAPAKAGKEAPLAKVELSQRNITKLAKLMPLTGITIVNDKGQKISNPKTLMKLRTQDLVDYKVVVNGKSAPLTNWLSRAKQDKLIEDFGLTEAQVDAVNLEEYLTEEFSDFSLTTVEEILAGAIGNMNDSDLDKDLLMFNRMAKLFGMNRPDDIVVIVDDDCYLDPTLYLSGPVDVAPVSTKNFSAYVCDDVDLCADYRNGICFLYFKNEADARAYHDIIDEFNLM